MTINKQSVLAIIPARGGSKGLSGKNIKSLAGKPMIAWTILAAQQSQYIDRIILSSDDEDIIAAAREYKCEVPFTRPPDLSTDKASSVEVVLHALEQLPAHDITVLLQPTSPLRNSTDIDNCLEKLLAENSPSCISVTKPDKSPYWMFTKDGSGKLCPILNANFADKQRQQMPETYVLNGAIYAIKTKHFIEKKCFVTRESIPYLMNKIRSVDIDDETDFQLAELILKKHNSIKFNYDNAEIPASTEILKRD